MNKAMHNGNGQVSKDVKEGFKEGRDNIENKFRMTKEQVADGTQKLAEEVTDYIQDAVSDLKSRTASLVAATKTSFKEKPVYYMLGAVALGACIGALMSRSRRHVAV